MAVESKYANSDIAANPTKLLPAREQGGADVQFIEARLEIAAGDDDGSRYVMFRGLPAGLIPYRIDIACDAITGGTDFALGLSETVEDEAAIGATIVKGVFTDGQTLATASDFGLNGMAAVAIENRNRPLWQHAGHTLLNKRGSYDMVLTGDTVGTVAGTVMVRVFFYTE